MACHPINDVHESMDTYLVGSTEHPVIIRQSFELDYIEYVVAHAHGHCNCDTSMQ